MQDIMVDEGNVGQCDYCGECLPCPYEIDIVAVFKLYDQVTEKPEGFTDAWAEYQLMPFNADDCTACGQCEALCPLGVPVVTRLAAVCELFDEEELVEDEEGYYDEFDEAVHEAQVDAFFASLYEGGEPQEVCFTEDCDDDGCDCCGHNHSH